MEDFFSGITDANGNPMSEQNVNPLMGYRIVHKVTGRLLPQCQKHEVMGIDYAYKRLLSVQQYYKEMNYEFDASEYVFEPVYLIELDDSKVLLLYTDDDQKNFGLFN